MNITKNIQMRLQYLAFVLPMKISWFTLKKDIESTNLTIEFPQEPNFTNEIQESKDIRSISVPIVEVKFFLICLCAYIKVSNIEKAESLSQLNDWSFGLFDNNDISSIESFRNKFNKIESIFEFSYVLNNWRTGMPFYRTNAWILYLISQIYYSKPMELKNDVFFDCIKRTSTLLKGLAYKLFEEEDEPHSDEKMPHMHIELSDMICMNFMLLFNEYRKNNPNNIQVAKIKERNKKIRNTKQNNNRPRQIAINKIVKYIERQVTTVDTKRSYIEESAEGDIEQHKKRKNDVSIQMACEEYIDKFCIDGQLWTPDKKSVIKGITKARTLQNIFSRKETNADNGSHSNLSRRLLSTIDYTVLFKEDASNVDEFVKMYWKKEMKRIDEFVKEYWREEILNEVHCHIMKSFPIHSTIIPLDNISQENESEQ